MDDVYVLLHIWYGLIILAISTGLYNAAITIRKMYYAHAYAVIDFPKTYIIKYTILPIEYNDDNTDSEFDSDQESEQSTFSGGDDILRLVMITSKPSEIVKKIKHAIKIDNTKEIFHLISYEILQ